MGLCSGFSSWLKTFPIIIYFKLLYQIIIQDPVYETMSLNPARICMKVISIISFLLFFQQGFSQYNWTELNKELSAKQSLLGNNIVTLIWKGDSLVFKNESGDFNAKTQAPVASCSKWLTAALVMQFVDEGKLKLDDPVMKYIPGFDLYFK